MGNSSSSKSLDLHGKKTDKKRNKKSKSQDFLAESATRRASEILCEVPTSDHDNFRNILPQNDKPETNNAEPNVSLENDGVKEKSDHEKTEQAELNKTDVPESEEELAVEEQKEVEEISSGEIESNAAANSSAMPIDLYYLPPSPPCRAVMMLARAINVDLNLKVVNILQGDHLKPEFLKLNPQHTIPTIVDNGLVLWESRAILAYLVNQYAPDDSLYPKEPKLRATIDQRLNFDLGTLTGRYINYYIPTLFAGAPLDPEKLKSLVEAVDLFNNILEGSKFAAGDQLSIADFTIITTISNMEALGFDFTPYTNVAQWCDRTKEALKPFGYEEINQAGVNIFADMFKSKLG